MATQIVDGKKITREVKTYTLRNGETKTVERVIEG